MAKPKKCMNHSCCSPATKRQVFARGLCENCYRTLRRMIQAEKLTWGDAENMNLALPPWHVGKKRFPRVRRK